MTCAAVSLVLAGRYGLDPARLGEWRIEDAAEARRRVLRLATSSEYERELESNGEEQIRLVERLLVHESSFFRHPRSFEHLGESVRNGRLNPSRSRPLRVLSVGCARGEEPYSAAIALLDAGALREALNIVAVDISPAVLGQAREGLYSARSVRAIPADVRRRWFDPARGGEWRLKEEVRRLVEFRSANVLDPDSAELGTHDVVLCRNLLIYLAPPARVRLATLIRSALGPQGTLYAGQSEVLALSFLGFVVEDRSALALRPEPALSGTAAGERLA